MICKTICTSCGACYAVCPRDAISMRRDALEQLRPKINKSKCIDCNLCEKVCPQNQELSFSSPIKCYAAYSNNEEDLRCSASGGIATVFCRSVLDNGIAVGCDYDVNCNLYHFELKNEDDLKKARGSKYSQSNSFVVFRDIKQALNCKKQVLFIGTPCQVSGLISFLQKPYDNLITVDLICHGTPPNELLRRHLKEQKLGNAISKIAFRGEYDKKITVWDNEKIIYQKEATQDVYFASFYKNMISNEACYTCRYATSKRVSDITIGDYWGLGTLEHIEKKTNRPSIVLINTNKGQGFFEEAFGGLVFEERSVEEGINGNGRLNVPPGKSFDARCFQLFYKLGFGFKRSVYMCNYINLFRKKLGI